MCTPKKPKTPPVVVRDPVKEAADAANEAAGKANADIAARRRRRRQSSLITTSARGYTGPANTLIQTASPTLAGV